jgi:hypothetical protein
MTKGGYMIIKDGRSPQWRLQDALLDQWGADLQFGIVRFQPFKAVHVAVTGPVTNDQLRAAGVDVSGPVTNDQLRPAHGYLRKAA